jgi:hypothetical protein
MAWVVDVVLDGTGSVALLGPFRSEQRAIELREKIEKVCKANGVEGYFPALSEVYPANEWFEHVDVGA